jgi:hypothetical protein
VKGNDEGISVPLTVGNVCAFRNRARIKKAVRKTVKN